MKSLKQKKIVILGAESLGREAAEIAQYQESVKSIVFLDDNQTLKNSAINGILVAGVFSDWKRYLDENTFFFIAIGKSGLREMLMEQIISNGGYIASLIHPGAFISSSSKVGDGCMINFGCHIGPNAEVGKGSILWSGVTVSHDCKIGDFCFIAPGVSIGGYSRIGQKCMIGINASIRSDISIGEQSVLSMGSVVTRNIAHKSYMERSGNVIRIDNEQPDSYFFKTHSKEALLLNRNLARPNK